jgi:hypothetical protein
MSRFDNEIPRRVAPIGRTYPSNWRAIAIKASVLAHCDDEAAAEREAVALKRALRRYFDLLKVQLRMMEGK